MVGVIREVMATDMQKLLGTSEEDDDEEMDMDVKEEDDGDQRNRGTHAASGSSNDEFMFQQSMQDQVGTPGGGSRRSRPLEEKERTKLRERHRRAITARILGGLRRHGNYNLRVRADINDVIAALAREAGWVVLPDGTTFPSKSQVLTYPVHVPCIVVYSLLSSMVREKLCVLRTFITPF